MRRLHVRSLALTISFAILAPSIAIAADKRQEANDEQQEEPKDKPLSFGVGMVAFLGAGFIDKPSDRNATKGFGPARDDIYPGFGGGSYGGGLMLEGRFLGVVGLEIDLFRSSDRGRGDVTVNGVKSTIELGQSAWHIPLLVKATISISPYVRPCIFAGPELVFPGDASASASPAAASPVGPNPTATVDSYTMLTGGLGFEFKLPIKDVDVRIPLSFRGSYHSLGSTVGDRVTYTNAGWVIDTTWKYQTQATLGASYFF